jgi:hypothetical protein
MYIVRLLLGVAIVWGLIDGSRWILRNQFSIEISDEIFSYAYLIGFFSVFSFAYKRFLTDQKSKEE